MKMPLNFSTAVATLLLGGFIAMKAFGMGADYSNAEPVGGTSAWPNGVKELVNSTNRVHGFFVNAEDIFFFSGNATNLNHFLGDYSMIQGVDKHQLILHEGTGEAKSPWDKSGKPCDWELFACPKSWLVGKTPAPGTNSIEVGRAAVQATNLVLEVHFWIGGKIGMGQLVIPKNVEVIKAK